MPARIAEVPLRNGRAAPAKQGIGERGPGFAEPRIQILCPTALGEGEQNLLSGAANPGPREPQRTFRDVEN